MKKSLQKIKHILKEHEPEMKSQFKVAQIGIFGSYARNEQKFDSDLDVLVKFNDSISLFTLIGLKNYLEDITGLKVDVVPVEDLRPEFRNDVDREAVFL